jgi:uncharacterized protein YutE (UPF0331/DUF86 family)
MKTKNLSNFVYSNLNENDLFSAKMFATRIFREDSSLIEYKIKETIKAIQKFSKSNQRVTKMFLKIGSILKQGKNPKTFEYVEDMRIRFAEMMLKLNNLHYFQTQILRGVVSIKENIPFEETVDNYKISLDVLKKHKDVITFDEYKEFALFNSFRNLFTHSSSEDLKHYLVGENISELMVLIISMGEVNKNIFNNYKKELNEIVCDCSKIEEDSKEFKKLDVFERLIS